MSRPPPPLEWHPAYRDQTWLIDWVNNGPSRRIVLPIPAKASCDFDEVNTYPLERRVTLERHRCIGLGVYTDDPYIWMWWVGVDSVGRRIAGESRRVAARLNPVTLTLEAAGP
jgi:hypothetical protein